jgi:hypothetical protein
VTVNIVAPHPERTQGSIMMGMGRVYNNGSRMMVSGRPPCSMEKPCVVRDVPPGEWTFDVQPSVLRETGDSPQLLYIGSVRFGSQEAWGKPVTVAEGGNPPLEITVTGDVGTLRLMVTNDDGRPTPAVMVARRVDGTEPPRRSNSPQFVGLLPGDYQVAAFGPNSQGMVVQGSPEKCDRAVTVTITAGQTSNVNLKPCESPPQPQ